MPFGITPLHIIVALVIAVIVLGPRKLPKIGSAAGKSIRQFRQAVPATRDAFVSELAPPSTDDPAPGSGAAAGAKVGSVAARSVRGFRNALVGARDAFQTEIEPGSEPPVDVGASPSAPAAALVSDLGGDPRT